MKRLLVLALLALGLTIVVVPTASPARPNDADAQGPPCSEITSGDGLLINGVLDFKVFLQAPACSFVTYSFFVVNLTENGGGAITPVTTEVANCAPETGEVCVHFVLTLPIGTPDTVCIFATTEIHGHLADRAPDLGPADPTCPSTFPSISLGDSPPASGGFG
jgi:hypothetical protein